MINLSPSAADHHLSDSTKNTADGSKYTADAVKNTADTIKNAAHKATDATQSGFDKTVDVAYNMAEKAGKTMHDFVDETSKQASHFYKSTEDTIIEHPMKSAAVVAGGAFVLGMLFSRLNRHA